MTLAPWEATNQAYDFGGRAKPARVGSALEAPIKAEAQHEIKQAKQAQQASKQHENMLPREAEKPKAHAMLACAVLGASKGGQAHASDVLEEVLPQKENVLSSALPENKNPKSTL